VDRREPGPSPIPGGVGGRWPAGRPSSSEFSPNQLTDRTPLGSVQRSDPGASAADLDVASIDREWEAVRRVVGAKGGHGIERTDPEEGRDVRRGPSTLTVRLIVWRVSARPREDAAVTILVHGPDAERWECARCHLWIGPPARAESAPREMPVVSSFN
jgi:hypothetical protein